LLFDKTAGSNWAAAWHQDLTIAVAERKDVNGYAAWSVKDGIPHVQPPVELLDRMVTVRLHLDPTPEEDGALKVIARSHRMGGLNAEDIQARVADGDSVMCACEEGDVLLMKPLILHASSPSVVQKHRRVIHFEYAPAHALDPSLSWAK
jgi:ectoine hydroxylase-related dioxygenase (phytanoyl-CoA dioxygenase family)